MAAGFYGLLALFGWKSSRPIVPVVTQRFALAGVHDKNFELEGVDDKSMALKGVEDEAFSLEGV